MLRGEKVILRAVERDDLERLWEFNNDVEVEVTGGGDPPYPQSLERLRAEFDDKAAKGGRDGMHFGIEADGMLIGICSLFGEDTVAGVAELGIAIGDKAYWGRGYGRDAIRTLLDYAFRLVNLRRVMLTVNGTNERAIRAYRACGFIEEGRLRQHAWSDGAYIDIVIMGVLREEWSGRGGDQSMS
jgi:RimJ/RimL family protein N-acetyltransferase